MPDVSWLASVALLSLRVGTLAIMAPPFGAAAIPATIRAAIAVTLAVFLASLPNASMPAGPTGAGSFIASALSELMLGAAMALGLNIAFAIFTFGARVVDVQIGFGLGQVLDPATKHPMPVLAAAFSQLALITFFALDGHHALMRGLVLSVEQIAPGAAWSADAAPVAIVRHGAQLFSLGFAMVAPVVFAMLLIEFALGVLARNMPQINALAMGLPIKALVGMAALGLWATSAGGIVARAHASVFSAWESLWR